jgi:signal transduction histidine kinase
VALEVTELEAALRKSDEERQRLLASEMAANEASRFKSLFVSNVSHEIRTPIAIMLSCTELLLTESIAPEHRQLLEKSLDAAQFLLDLVSQVLDIGKIEGGQLTLDPRPFLLSSSAADVNLLILSKRPSDRVRFLDESQPVYRELVYGDAVRLKQILLNLLGNAVKFCLDGFISFSMMQESETDTLVNMLYVVRDTGIGISPEDAKKLFTPFRQAEASTHSKYGGSGLGLYVSKQLAELMGGSIALESAVGQGTTVSVRLPFLKAAPSRTASPAIVKPVYELPVPRHHIKILLAEGGSLRCRKRLPADSLAR